jgi:hypothetical protein
MRRLSFNERERAMLKRQARSSRTTLRQLFELLDKPMQPQNGKETKKEDQHTLAFCYRLSRYKHRFAQTGASIKATPALIARGVAPGLRVG